MSTQNQRLLAYLDKGYSITRINSFKELGIFELSARICELKKYGHNIKIERIKGLNQFGEKINYCKYSLIKPVDSTPYEHNRGYVL